MAETTKKTDHKLVEFSAPKEFKYVRDRFDTAGLNSFDNAPHQDPEDFEQLDNVVPVTTGSLARRWGYELKGSTTDVVRKLYEYQSDSLGTRRLIGTATTGVQAFTEAGASAGALFTPGIGAFVPRVAVSRDFAYFADGLAADLKKWDGDATVSKWGIVAPASACTVGTPVAGAITLVGGRKYYTAFYNANTGHVSGLSPVSASTGPIKTKNIPLTALPVSADPQVTHKLLLGTGDGGNEQILYLIQAIANATTTATDSMPEEILLLSNIYLQLDEFGDEHGIADNDPPVNAILPTKHKGRIFMAAGQYIIFSKSLDEVTTSTGLITSRYEEAFPPEHQLDVAAGAETIRAMLSDGDALYVGTERHVRRIEGDAPTNFSRPEVAYNNVGVLSQDVWKVVFFQGAPVGTVWLTPDMRLIASDFNTFRNIGTPIQDLLNSINPAAVSRCQAITGSQGAFDFYMLAIPTGVNTECDTVIVYMVGSQKFFIWKLTDSPTSMLYNIDAAGNIQWLFTSATQKLYQFNLAATQDRVADTPVSFTVTARTSWLHMGNPTTRKILQELEIIGDPTMTVTVHGATTAADFRSPRTVASNAPLTLSPFGQWKLYLAGKLSRDRFYRLTFTSTATTPAFLDTYQIRALEGIPF
jgi:hypothetical protein